MPHRLPAAGPILAFLLIAATSALLVAATSGGARASRDAAACAAITAACHRAGFTVKHAEAGSRVMRDCVRPIMGTRSPSAPTRPLPSVDPQLVETCRSEEPAFGQSRQTIAPVARTIPERPAAAVDELKQVSTPLPGGLTRPNIVFVLTDDLSMNLLPYMPNVQAMQRDGASFSRYYVTDSLCCPSRASIFTGQLPHDTGVFTNTPPEGGYPVFNANGKDGETFALALHGAGYRTAMLGKYLNAYWPKDGDAAPGWDEWDVAGDGYAGFNYSMNQNGEIVQYGNAPTDYLTDVIAGMADRFIRASASGPFFIEISTFAPHAPATPAPRDADKFPGATVPRTPAYAARPDDNAPRWLKEIPPLSAHEMTVIDGKFRLRTQAVQAVDKMVGDLRAELAELGLADRTYIVFSSDNGYHMGDFSLRPGKMTPFDTDIQVPLIVVGPGIAKGAVIDEIAENIDLCPTFTDLGGDPGPTVPDGRSLVPLLLGEPQPDWRQSALIEHHRPGKSDIADPDAPPSNSANPETYEALRTTDALYVEYKDGETSLYDVAADPYELRNIAPTLPAAALDPYRTALAASKACEGSAQCAEAQAIRADKNW